MKLIRQIFFISTLVVGLTGLAQGQPSTDEQLAAHYYQSDDFEMAALYYEKLYKKEPSDFYYGYYLSSLLKLKKYNDSEKLIKKQIKRYPDNPSYLVDLGNNYKLLKNEDKAKSQFEKAIKQVPARQKEIIDLARYFLSLDETEYALETYEKGEKLMKGYYLFNFEKGEVYEKMGNYEAMIDEYLGMLQVDEGYVQSVQNALGRSIDFNAGASKELTLLRERLLRQVQKNPNLGIYSEMLIWLHLQQKDFRAALVQAKALDRRQKEDGSRLISLANLCLSNQEYDVAVKAFDHVIAKGPITPYFVQAKIERLKALNDKITTTPDYTQEDLTTLESSYIEAIEELSRSAGTVELLKDLAYLQAYYLHKTDDAIQLLEEAIATPRIEPQFQAECKLTLGDILLLKGEIWDASLYYSQVDKAFKYDRLGEKAKFRNAKISYYTGDFAWAKAQLDVLKGSTSKLISNDALDLSLLITDNTGIDTTENTLKMFARADLLTVQNLDDQALTTLDSINKLYPFHAIEDEVLMKRYEIMMKRRDYEKAAGHLQKIIDDHGDNILADDALFKLAELTQFQFKDLKKAQELYKQIMLEHTDSLFVVEARKRFRYLRGDTTSMDGQEYEAIPTN